MRRTCVTGAAVAIVALMTCNAAGAATWHTGARAGVSAATLRGDFADISDPELLYAPTVGGALELEVSPSWTVAVEAMYVQKGAKFTGTFVEFTGDPTGTLDVHLVLEYAEVPILLRASLGSGSFRPYLIAGPTFGFALDATQKSDLFPDITFSEDMKPLDLGATAGIGVRLPTQGALRFDIEGRYFTSFSDLWDISENLESINQGFSLTLGVSR
jgi:hypothetical protein